MSACEGAALGVATPEGEAPLGVLDDALNAAEIDLASAMRHLKGRAAMIEAGQSVPADLAKLRACQSFGAATRQRRWPRSTRCSSASPTRSRRCGCVSKCSV